MTGHRRRNDFSASSHEGAAAKLLGHVFLPFHSSLCLPSSLVCLFSPPLACFLFLPCGFVSLVSRTCWPFASPFFAGEALVCRMCLQTSPYTECTDGGDFCLAGPGQYCQVLRVICSKVGLFEIPLPLPFPHAGVGGRRGQVSLALGCHLVGERHVRDQPCDGNAVTAAVLVSLGSPEPQGSGSASGSRGREDKGSPVSALAAHLFLSLIRNRSGY